MMFWDAVLGYLGAAKYAASSECLTSDYVLVRMFTVLQLINGFSCVIAAALMYICYRDGNHMLRLSVVLLKDAWIVRLLGLFLLLMGLNQFVGVLTLHYGVYNLQVVTLTAMASVSTYTMVKLCSIALDKTRQTSILTEMLTEVSGEVANYGDEPVEGQHIVKDPLPIKAGTPKKE